MKVSKSLAITLITLKILLVMLSFPITGSGKEVTLKWERSQDENIDHYVVYWGTESRLYKHNSPPIKDATTYTIEGLEEHKVYYFAAKAVGVTGLESGFSNEAAIPRIEYPKEFCTINANNCFDFSIKGTAAASSVVEIMFNATPLGTTIALNDGTWSIDLDFSSAPECLFELKAVSTGAESNSVKGQHDKTPPSSYISEAPTGVQGILKAKFTIRWIASDDASRVNSTELWVKKGADGAWFNSGRPSQEGESGVFGYQPAAGSGMYYFSTRTSDSAGNVEGLPTGKGETSIQLQADLSDAVMALQILSGIDAGEVNPGSDVNGDGRIGMQEVIYFMKDLLSSDSLI